MRNAHIEGSSGNAGDIAASNNLGLRIENGLAVLSIERADKRNALTLAMWRAIGAVMTELDARADVRVIAITGSGPSFCAGADISEFATVRSNPEQVVIYEEAVDGCCDAIANVSKPTMAAINGFCMGGAMNLAMACDFRYAVPDAKLSIPAARLSIVYGLKGTRRLFELVGLSNAKRILFSGEPFGAIEGFRIGLVDEVDEDVMGHTRSVAAVLADNAPLSISGAKAILNGLASADPALTPATVQALVDRAADSEDYAEGRRAFGEKRRPMFQGR
ncbi:enoyl-CoA hydratase-related protein [Cupriavidus pauculus]|uniref:3-hydroxybutyryl-CoA dehydratase n=1 Tax=Cupriavidus pauculus TaxID=82633 RepID=A0A2N5C3E1_9BURK|nr:enoyl-CoA hydratase-related protein [Cupriavidus pauculus]PLP96731.1 3-hydroxybutyryl-CoA dehydratase [Cupriavidus pauculus]